MLPSTGIQTCCQAISVSREFTVKPRILTFSHLNNLVLHQLVHRKKSWLSNKFQCSSPDNPVLLIHQHDEKHLISQATKDRMRVSLPCCEYFPACWFLLLLLVKWTLSTILQHKEAIKCADVVAKGVKVLTKQGITGN